MWETVAIIVALGGLDYALASQSLCGQQGPRNATQATGNPGRDLDGVGDLELRRRE